MRDSKAKVASQSLGSGAPVAEVGLSSPPIAEPKSDQFLSGLIGQIDVAARKMQQAPSSPPLVPPANHAGTTASPQVRFDLDQGGRKS